MGIGQENTLGSVDLITLKIIKYINRELLSKITSVSSVSEFIACIFVLSHYIAAKYADLMSNGNYAFGFGIVDRLQLEVKLQYVIKLRNTLSHMTSWGKITDAFNNYDEMISNLDVSKVDDSEIKRCLLLLKEFNHNEVKEVLWKAQRQLNIELALDKISDR